MPLPQQGPQSAGQFEQFSPAPQMPLPHVSGHWPQSAGQVLQVSPMAGMHLPSPQAGQGPQSLGQLWQVSVGPHFESPHVSGH